MTLSVNSSSTPPSLCPFNWTCPCMRGSFSSSGWQHRDYIWCHGGPEWTNPAATAMTAVDTVLSTIQVALNVTKTVLSPCESTKVLTLTNTVASNTTLTRTTLWTTLIGISETVLSTSEIIVVQTIPSTSEITTTVSSTNQVISTEITPSTEIISSTSQVLTTYTSTATNQFITTDTVLSTSISGTATTSTVLSTQVVISPMIICSNNTFQSSNPPLFPNIDGAYTYFDNNYWALMCLNLPGLGNYLIP
jgi:hypothetical protein